MTDSGTVRALLRGTGLRGGVLRGTVLSFAAGLLMGALYRALDVVSPAPPLIGLTGLAGIVLGERAATAVRDRLTRRSAPPPPAPPPSPPSAAEQGDARVT